MSNQKNQIKYVITNEHVFFFIGPILEARSEILKKYLFVFWGRFEDTKFSFWIFKNKNAPLEIMSTHLYGVSSK